MRIAVTFLSHLDQLLEIGLIPDNAMTCEELLKALNEYVDDEAALAVCREFAGSLPSIWRAVIHARLWWTIFARAALCTKRVSPIECLPSLKLACETVCRNGGIRSSGKRTDLAFWNAIPESIVTFSTLLDQ